MLTQIQENFYDWVVYQVYPRSFMDTNNDGIGDLNGITAKLDYLKDLGVNAVWLSPCYKSPNVDNGYDISDYRDIMDDFGTMEDWENMISQMHKRGIKLIMDFVANHTSSEHKWFKESRKSKDNPYRDYYCWADKPLNDWKSAFGGSAWEYDETTNQYYLHSFAIEQPDLNWENPKVQQEMKDIVDFWVKRGVDGFRCDVLDMISKDYYGSNRNGPKLHEYINMLFGREEVKHIFTVGECWGADENNIKMLIDGSRNELSSVFQFDHTQVGIKGKYAPKDFSLADVRNMLVKWQNLMNKNELLYMLFFENHDSPRSVSRFGNDSDFRYESATMLSAMLYLQKGMPFIFQGQEIGAVNHTAKSIGEFKDLEALNFYYEKINNTDEKTLLKRLNMFSRDNSRHPMPWSDGVYSGFSSVKPWIDTYDSYKEINVKNDLMSENSIYRFYQKVLKIRKDYCCIRHGNYEDMTAGRDNCYIYRRFDDNNEIWVICNFENESNINLNIKGEVLLSNYQRKNIDEKLKPYECAVIKLK